MQTHYIYLAAGFFGFSNLGGITYFHHVREILEEELKNFGIDARIFYVPTLPTASIRRRTQRMCDTIVATATDPDAPIHIIGHSTGGLDARLFVTPGVNLGGDHDVEAYAKRVASVVTVATPHLGTPIAAFFNSVFGQNLLYMLTLVSIYSLRFGRVPLSALVKLVGVITHLDDKLGLQNTILDQFYRELFADFDDSRREMIKTFLNDIFEDRAALGQLTPGSIDLFNASTSDRPTVNYGCVVTCAERLTPRSLLKLHFNPYDAASNAIYRALQFITARNQDVPPPKHDQQLALEKALGEMPTRRDNDGVVPTLSQLWGEVIHAVKADHLDVCGHFKDREHKPPHVDWLISGCGFRRPAFEALWHDVAEFLAREPRTRMKKRKSK